jgi:two-component system OmpR family sensor kinase
VLVQADEARVRQVVTNLLANVREHTPPGTAVDVEISALNGHAVLQVTDDGPGLSTDALTHAFDRFWRADDARHHRPGAAGGSGLGLAIVDAITAAHGGSVQATNVAGRGARFTVTLPAANTHKQLQSSPQAAPSGR